MDQYTAEQYIVEVTKRPEGTKGKQVEAVAATFNIPAHKAQQLLHRLPGVVTKPVPARLANEIAGRFQKAGMEAVVRAHAAEPFSGVATPSQPKVKLPEPDAFTTAVDKMFTTDSGSSTTQQLTFEPSAFEPSSFDAADAHNPDFNNSDFDSADFDGADFDGADFSNEVPTEPDTQPNVVIALAGNTTDLFENGASHEEAVVGKPEEGPVLSEVSARDAAKESRPEAAAKLTAREAVKEDLPPEEEAIDLEALESPDKKQPSKLLLPIFLLLVAAILVAWFFFL